MKIKFAGTFFILLITTMTFSVILSEFNVSAQALPRVSLTAPDTVDVSETRKFNATVWVTGSMEHVFLYQVYMTVDDSILSVNRAWIPSWDSSWMFYGKVTLSPDPAIEDENNNGANEAVIIGSSLLMDYEGIPVSGTNSLAIIELQILSSPNTALLNINNTDTYILNADLDEVPVEKQNKQVTIVGEMPAETSEITIEANPTTVFIGRNVTFSGKITPDKPNVDVKIEEKISEMNPWMEIATVKTNQTSQYKLTCSFLEPGSPQFRASWDGDDTHLGNTSETVQISVVKLYTRLEIRFADEDVKHIGEFDEVLPPSFPTAFNVTVVNVTDLCEWQIKIYYVPSFARIDDVWLPADNIFSLQGLTYNSTIDMGTDEHGSYLYCEAAVNVTGGSFSGNGTLFQFNLTGLFAASTVLDLEPILKNLGDNEILFEYEAFEFNILGTVPTAMRIINPATGNINFVFYTADTPVGTVFNATVLTEEALDLSGWALKLTYNATILNVTTVVQPVENVDYVFNGKISNFTWSNEHGTLLVENMLDDSEAPFNGEGLLTVIKFEILLAPTNETEQLGCALVLEEAEIFIAVSKSWQTATAADGGYLYRFGTSGNGDGDNGTADSIWNYWPYMVGSIVIIVVVYLVYKKVRKGREFYIDEEEEWGA